MKKVLSLVLALACVLSLSAVAFAADAVDPAKVYNGDGEEVSDISVAANVIKGDPVEPASTFYVPISPAMDTQIKDGDDVDFTVEDLVDTKNFKFDVDKDAGSKLISKISVVDDKKLGSMERTAYLKFELKDVTDTDEHKSTGTITFKAKNYKLAGCKPGSKTESSGANDAKWTDNYEVTFKYNLWISNEKKGNDDNPDVGDRVYMDPDANDTNTLIWGDDRAALKFEADDDAKKFYARLSTSNMSDIYAEYGDPVDADLWFYNFTGNKTIPATSKATLTLGIPWDDDDDYTPNPHDVYIYRLDKDGYLEDVTAMFTYSEDDREIEGWTTRTRTLGTYIVSDTELDIDSYYDDDDDTEVPSIDVSNNQKPVPNTGR